jgi:hypothetical protein
MKTPTLPTTPHDAVLFIRTHDPIEREAVAQGLALEVERWHRSYQILSMALGLSVVVNIVMILLEAIR